MTSRPVVASTAFALLVSLAAAAAVFFPVERRAIGRAQSAARVQLLEYIVPVCQYSLATDNKSVLLDSFRLLTQDPAIVSAAVERPDGRIFLHSDFLKGDSRLEGKKADSADLAWTANGGRRVIESSAPVFEKARKAAIIRVFYNDDALQQAASGQLRQNFLMFLEIAAVAYLAGLAAAALIPAAAAKSYHNS